MNPLSFVNFLNKFNMYSHHRNRKNINYFFLILFSSHTSVWADSENGVNGSDFSKVKILRKRSSAHAHLIKISHIYVKTKHFGKLIVQCGLFICRSEITFKCFIRHVSTECIWQKYKFVWHIKFYLMVKISQFCFRRRYQ